MHLLCLVFKKQVYGQAWKRITSDLGGPIQTSDAEDQALGSGLMGSHMLLRQGVGWGQRAWNTGIVRPQSILRALGATLKSRSHAAAN